MYNYRIFEFGNIYCSGEISGSGASFQLFLPSSTILEMDVKDKKNKNVTKKKNSSTNVNFVFTKKIKDLLLKIDCSVRYNLPIYNSDITYLYNNIYINHILVVSSYSNSLMNSISNNFFNLNV